MIHIPRAWATTYANYSKTGKTKPLLLRCAMEDGSLEDYYVKTVAGLAWFDSDPARELICSVLAQLFGIPTPAPAIVMLDPDLASVIPVRDQKAISDWIAKSTGPNFGTRLLGPGSTAYSPRKRLPMGDMQRALDIYAFDALIQNRDRLFTKPNLLSFRGDIFAIDHDEAFFDLPPAGPADMEGPRFQTRASNHVFYPGLRRKSVFCESFAESLGNLSDETIDAMFAAVPAEWQNGYLDRIRRHLKYWRSNAQALKHAVKASLG